jgi:hypothetical protein
VQQHYLEDVDAARLIVDRVGEHHAAYIDLAGALYRAGQLEEGDKCVRQALSLGYPSPGLALNYLAVSAFRRGDLETMKKVFLEAAKTDPQHHVLITNVERVREWFRISGPERGIPLELDARHDFQLLERTLQPTLPGPLSDDLYDWQSTPAAVPRDLPSSRDVTPERYGKQGFGQRRLKVLS